MAERCDRRCGCARVEVQLGRSVAAVGATWLQPAVRGGRMLPGVLTRETQCCAPLLCRRSPALSV